jgi:hypothetical protein
MKAKKKEKGGKSGSDIDGGEGLDEFINWQCLCIDPLTGVVTESPIYKISYYNKYPKSLCDGSLRSVYNAQDFYESFFTWCNLYTQKKICKTEDKVNKLLKFAKRGKKDKKKGRKNKW